jgi:hypothetical protein
MQGIYKRQKMKCRVYKIQGGDYDEGYNYLLFIPSYQPKERDKLFIPKTDSYGSDDGTYLGVWDFEDKFLGSLYKQIKPRLKLVAYEG